MTPARYTGPEPTLEHLRSNYGWVWARCALPCAHDAAIPLAPIVARLGADKPAQALRGRLRCTVCGRRQAGLRMPSWAMENGIASLPLDHVPPALMREMANDALRSIGAQRYRTP